MAILISDGICGICERPLAVEDAVSFPAFVANLRDPLRRFSDGVFHRACLERDPEGVLASSLSDAAVTAGRPDARSCAVCGEIIEDPDDYFGTGLLSSEPSSPLAKFNFVHLHRSHWGRWGKANALVNELKRVLASGEWEGPELAFEDARPAWVSRR